MKNSHRVIALLAAAGCIDKTPHLSAFRLDISGDVDVCGLDDLCLDE